MADTPNLLRGEYYWTHRVARCPSYKQCPVPVCRMCVNFNPYSVACVHCETRKKPLRVCKCSEYTKNTIRLIEQRKQQRILDHSNKSSINEVDVSDVADWNTVANNLRIAAQKF